MILQSLLNYYEILAAADRISKPGYCMASVSYALNLSESGELVGIIPLKIQVQRSKKTVEVPQSMEVPEQIKKSSGIASNFLCENSSYMLGLDSKGKPDRTADCFAAFHKLHTDILKPIDNAYARAITAFLNQWQPANAADNPVLREYLDDMTAGANLVFHLEGAGFAHLDAAVKKAWERHMQSSPDAVEMQCLVTGETAPIARLHPNFKHVKGAQSMGASIVSFNASAYESYSHDGLQGLNAPVSVYAAFAYATALNYLLSDPLHRQTLGDTTVIYWADSAQPIYQDIFSFALNPDDRTPEQVDDRTSAHDIGNLFQKIATGSPLRDISNEIDSSTRFYVLGLAPNAARLSIRFFLRDSFGNMIERVLAHYKNLEIHRAPFEPQFVPLWKLMQETVSPNSTDKASSPLLTGAVLRAILSGSPYPASLYSSVMVRIRAERDISRGKAALLKACLIRKYPNDLNFKEVLTVALNEQSKNRAYSLGRLFSVLEKAQQDANPGIKATIKDRYFTSACATPAGVFPVLLRLSSHHTAKSDFGYASENRIRDLMDKLEVSDNPFPSHLSLDDQGIFILGYYHQQKANYTKTNKEEK